MYHYDPYFLTTWYNKKFAFLPTRLHNGKRIWLKTYYRKVIGGIFSGFSSSLEIAKISEEEYLSIKYSNDPLGRFHNEMEKL